MRITVELIQKSPQYINPLRERELCLRGLKIPALENLGATLDQYDCIDLTNNEITKLEETAPLRRLNTLLLSNNHIVKIASSFGNNLPYLENLVFINNKLTSLAEIENLASCVSLKRLALLDNLVTKQLNYRLYVINKLPNLTVLDFQKISLKVISTQERKQAKALYGHEEEEQEDELLLDHDTEFKSTADSLPAYLGEQGEKLNGA